MERTRDVVTGELTLDYFVRRAAEGWKLAAVEWVREAEAPVAGETRTFETGPARDARLPYGLQLSPEGSRLEENPLEMTVLLLILEQIIQEKRITEIAAVLNQSGFQTRDGHVWSATAVFNLLPRLIEVGPAVLKSSAWHERRPKASGFAPS